MQVSTSSYYKYIERRDKVKCSDDLETALKTAFWRHKRRYGARRLVAELEDEAYFIGRRKVRRLMRKNGLVAIQPKSFIPKTTQPNDSLYRNPNLLIDRAKAVGCDEVWVGDITYLPLAGGEWAYLSTWLDLYSRHIVGWDVQSHMKEDLVLTSFEKAVSKRSPSKGLIIHSDGGGQYKSRKFRKRLNNYGYLQSMTRKDNHYDNAHAESLFSRLKAELLEDGVFLDVEEARMECFDYIDCYYNPIRRHSSLGNISPLQFEKKYLLTKRKKISGK